MHLGFAQKLFLEKPQRSEALPEALLSNRNISYADYALAKYLLKSVPEKTDDLFAFLCYLSMAMRAGHGCVQVQPILAPNPKQLVEELCEGFLEIDSGTLSNFVTSVQKGIHDLPQSLISTVNRSDISPDTPICRHGNLIYFQRYWNAETSLLHHLQRLSEAAPRFQFDSGSVYTTQINLLPEQAQAIDCALRNPFFILSGGPGTGKTYTAGHLIKTFWSSLSTEQQHGCRIVLAAPTGKAAANLQASISRATNGLPNFPALKAQTLHALLGVNSYRKPTKLSADFILVDESSMIDILLMNTLLSSIKTGARLILIGDKHQLPPVGVGVPFGDLVKKISATAELTVCMRSELKPIVNLASAIHRGESDMALEYLSKHPQVITRFDHSSSVKLSQKEILNHTLSHHSQLHFNADRPEAALNALNHFCVLTPLREGPFGVNTLNQLIAGALPQENFVAPIVITKNDHRFELSNGEIGLLVRKNKTFVQKGDSAFFKKGDSVVKIPALLLPKYDYAYCLSVHKSQGSEFNHVLLLMPEGSEIFGREVLYTAVTRVRKQLDIWGSDETLRKTINRTAQRLSGIQTCP